jgi:thioredoxin
MALPLVDERSFRTKVLQSELPVLIEFYADWSAPCKMIEPEVEALAQEMKGKANFVRVNTDKSPALVRELRVQSLPAFMVVAGGQIVDAQTGALRRAQLRAMLEPHLPRAEGAIKPVELAQLMNEGQVTPVDIREPGVYARAHLPRAVNLPEDEIEGRLAELHMLAGEPVLYCRSGDRSKALSAKLAEQGIPVAFLEGGVLHWEAEGLSLERPD